MVVILVERCGQILEVCRQYHCQHWWWVEDEGEGEIAVSDGDS